MIARLSGNDVYRTEKESLGTATAGTAVNPLLEADVNAIVEGYAKFGKE